jgi:hypothetical protein
MNNEVAAVRLPWSDPDLVSLDSSDDEPDPFDTARYCPTRLLAAFALLMSGHNRCVNTDMMLGDRDYALWQLARAHTLGDPELREIAARLFFFFDDPDAPIPPGLRF